MDSLMDECTREADDCRDTHVATQLKIGSICIILAACVVGVCMPLLGRYISAFRAESNLFFVMKSFAAGVILATAYVHMLPDAFEALGNPCLAENPWAKFPFAGFLSMLATLFTLMIDFFATTYYENKQQRTYVGSAAQAEYQLEGPQKGKLMTRDTELGGTAGDAANLATVPVHAHAAVHVEHGSHTHSLVLSEDESIQLRHRVISQARYKRKAAALMGFFFSVTTPLGIGIGMGIASTYNENSPKALMVQGIFDSMSAGILLYMSLVDLIAADFLSKRLRSDLRLQLYTYSALFLGAGAMSVIAYWA